MILGELPHMPLQLIVALISYIMEYKRIEYLEAHGIK